MSYFIAKFVKSDLMQAESKQQSVSSVSSMFADLFSWETTFKIFSEFQNQRVIDSVPSEFVVVIAAAVVFAVASDAVVVVVSAIACIRATESVSTCEIDKFGLCLTPSNHWRVPQSLQETRPEPRREIWPTPKGKTDAQTFADHGYDNQAYQRQDHVNLAYAMLTAVAILRCR